MISCIPTPREAVEIPDWVPLVIPISYLSLFPRRGFSKIAARSFNASLIFRAFSCGNNYPQL
jgi:hypothetical protein